MIYAVYGLLLLAASLLLPLRLGEILHAAALESFSWGRLFQWIGWTPGAAPLSYLVLLPALAAPHARLALRLPAMLFALGSSYLFFGLAKVIPLRLPNVALLAFLAMPVHYYFATQARPFEQGLFLLLLAAIFFFRMVEKPTVTLAVLYGSALTACLYTEPSCFLPACGYVLFLLRFANGRAERRALWFALPATAIPAFLYAPYYTWARDHADAAWLTEPSHAEGLFGQLIASLAPGEWSLALGAPLAILLLMGLFFGAWLALPPMEKLVGGASPFANLGQRRRIILFCLSGGSSVAILARLTVDAWNRTPFTANEVLWSAPGLIIVFFAALERLSDASLPKLLSPLDPLLRALSPILAVLLIGISLLGDATYLLTPSSDVEALSNLIGPELKGEACVVFVSEHLSRYIWLLFQPELEEHECRNFFHRRVVLAIHPWVTHTHQRNAEQYFRGMNFAEKNRRILEGGQVVTLETEK